MLHAQVRLVQGRYRTRVIEAGRGSTGRRQLSWPVGSVAALAAHFHVVALDSLRQGRPQTEGFDPEVIPLLSDQVTDVMDPLGIGQACFEGQSLGGWVAMQLALCRPQKVRALVLTTTMGCSPDEGAIPGDAEPDRASNLPSSLEVLCNPIFDAVRARLARIFANPARLTDEVIRVRHAHYLQPVLATVQQHFIAEYLADDTIRRHTVTNAMVRRITQPTLVYWGDRNRTLRRRLASASRSGCSTAVSTAPPTLTLTLTLTLNLNLNLNRRRPQSSVVRQYAPE
ncbi:MAG: alpha/beta fold hydrolase [Thauera sp.]